MEALAKRKSDELSKKIKDLEKKYPIKTRTTQQNRLIQSLKNRKNSENEQARLFIQNIKKTVSMNTKSENKIGQNSKPVLVKKPKNNTESAPQNNRPPLSARDEFKFRMYSLIDENEEKIQTSINKKMKQTIDRLYKTAIYHIVNDTDYDVLSKKKSDEINGRKATSERGGKKGTKELILEENSSIVCKTDVTRQDCVLTIRMKK